MSHLESGDKASGALILSHTSSNNIENKSLTSKQRLADIPTFNHQLMGDGLEASDTIVKQKKVAGNAEVAIAPSSASAQQLFSTVSKALDHFSQSHKKV